MTFSGLSKSKFSQNSYIMLILNEISNYITPIKKIKIELFIRFTLMSRDEVKVAVNCSVLIKKYGHILKWNVQNITDISYIFSECCNFNLQLNNWDVVNVIDMENMFYYCKNLN